VNHLPDSNAISRGRVPIGCELLRFEQADLACFRGEDDGHAAQAGVLGFRERFRAAVLAFGETVLFEPDQCPAGFSVEIALLFGKDFIQDFVDERERLADGDRPAFGVEDLRVARVHGHARANGGLRQIDKKNIAAFAGARGQRGVRI